MSSLCLLAGELESNAKRFEQVGHAVLSKGLPGWKLCCTRQIAWLFSLMQCPGACWAGSSDVFSG